MRVLIVSAGLKPDHFGGLPSHVEDLLAALVNAGLKVAYLNTGAKSKWPITRLWRRTDLPFPAWNLSSDLAYTNYWEGSFRPLSQIEPDSAFQNAFLSVIDQFKPDLVHVHELTGFPIQLFAVLSRLGVRSVFSAHDFFVFCPTVKLLRPNHSFCERNQEDLDCHLCSVTARDGRAAQWQYANDYWLGNFPTLRNLGRRLIRSIEKLLMIFPSSDQWSYIERSKRFEEIFRMVDLVLVTSRQQERIFRQRTNGWNIGFLQLSRITIQQERPILRLATRSPGKIVFVALNIVNPAKGLFLLVEAFRSLQKKYSQVELHVYGLCERTETLIRYMGPYEDEQLDAILSTADFGILPSIWHEAFGYVGPEMLSRGLPVIATNRGAMPDYVMHGVNGLLFDPDVPNSLENCVTQILENQNLRLQLWKGAGCGDRHYLSMQQHTEKLLTFYHSVWGTPLARRQQNNRHEAD